MDYGALPPEINSARMYAGPGSGSMLAAASAWDRLAADLHSTAAAAGSVVSGLTDEAWRGFSSASMSAAVAPFLTWMSATSVQLEQVANQARAAAAAYEAAFAMTVPPAAVAANRAQLMALIATNFLGQNTPAIMATEAQYGQMWAQDAAAMYGYAASSAAASTLAPFTPPKSTTDPAGVTGQSAAVVQAAGTSAGSHAQTVASTSLSSVPQTLQGLAQPVQSANGFVTGNGAALASSTASGSSGPLSALSSLAGATGKGAGNGASTGANATSSLGTLAGLLGDSTGPGGLAGYAADAAGLGADGLGLGTDAGGLGTDFAGVGLDFLGADSLFQSGGLSPFDGLGGLGLAPHALAPAQLGPLGFGGGSAASMGQASSVGALSVPQTWADASPAAGSASSPSAMALPANGFGAAPAASTNGPATPKVFPAPVERENDALQLIGLRANMIPPPLVG
jgi:PPE-repeat protein